MRWMGHQHYIFNGRAPKWNYVHRTIFVWSKWHVKILSNPLNFYTKTSRARLAISWCRLPIERQNSRARLELFQVLEPRDHLFMEVGKVCQEFLLRLLVGVLELHRRKLVEGASHRLPDHGPRDLLLRLCGRLHAVASHVVKRDDVFEHAHRLVEGAVPARTVGIFIIILFPRTDKLIFYGFATDMRCIKLSGL